MKQPNGITLCSGEILPEGFPVAIKTVNKKYGGLFFSLWLCSPSSKLPQFALN